MTNINFSSIKGILFAGDMHFEFDSLEELKTIIFELLQISVDYNCNFFIQLGDLCDKNRLEAFELFELVRCITNLKKRFDRVIIIEGNHDKKEKEVAIINFLKFLDIAICPDEMLFDTPFGKILCGHWFVDKSKDAFGTHHKYTVEALKKKFVFDYCLLGHQHDFQQIDNIYHLGSSRFVSFGENASSKKQLAILNKEGLKFVELKSVIPIYNIDNIEDLKNVPEKSKVRYIFRSFSSLKNDIKTVSQMKDKFYSFKKKLDFSTTTNFAKQDTNLLVKKSQKEIVQSWLKDIQDTELRNILEAEFVKEFKL